MASQSHRGIGCLISWKQDSNQLEATLLGLFIWSYLILGSPRQRPTQWPVCKMIAGWSDSGRRSRRRKPQSQCILSVTTQGLRTWLRGTFWEKQGLMSVKYLLCCIRSKLSLSLHQEPSFSKLPFSFAVLDAEPRLLRMLGSATELCPQQPLC